MTEEEKSRFQKVLESITPEEKKLLEKYSSLDDLQMVKEKDIPALQRLQKSKGVIWSSGSGDIKPGQYVGHSIFGGWIYDALSKSSCASDKVIKMAEEKSKKRHWQIRYHIRPEIAKLLEEFSDIDDMDIIDFREKLLNRLLLIDVP